MLSVEKIKIEINVFVKEKLFIGQIFCRGNLRKIKVTKFHKQIRHFSTNITLTVKATEIAEKQTGTSDL